jgi:uncharacterized protein (DUF2252 family)
MARNKPEPKPEPTPDRNYFGLASPSMAQPLLRGALAERSTRAERLAQGRALRKVVPRASHAAYTALPDRDPIAIIQQQNVSRLQRLVPVRHARMLASPFAFLRGSAAVMAADLVATPITGLNVAACGDMHVANFGLFASAERNLIFAINDFDEMHPGPWEWDLKRLAASAAVAARFMGGDRDHARAAAQAAVSSYRRHMRTYAEMPFLAVWYERIDEQRILAVVPDKLRRKATQIIGKARAKGHLRALDRMTEEVGGTQRLVEDVPLIVRETHGADGTPIAEAMDIMLRAYLASLPEDRKLLLARYRIMDVARKTVGVGSVGTSCWVVYLQGTGSDDPLFLQVKEAGPSVLAPHVAAKLNMTHQGRRVVTGQRLTQGSPDIFLGWGEVGDRQFFVRQLADMKGGARFDGGEESLEGFDPYCALCGWALALAHAKSGDSAVIAGYCGKNEELDEAIGRFALAYMEQTEADHAALARAAKSGRVPVAADAS